MVENLLRWAFRSRLSATRPLTLRSAIFVGYVWLAMKAGLSPSVSTANAGTVQKNHNFELKTDGTLVRKDGPLRDQFGQPFEVNRSRLGIEQGNLSAASTMTDSAQTPTGAHQFLSAAVPDVDSANAIFAACGMGAMTRVSGPEVQPETVVQARQALAEVYPEDMLDSPEAMQSYIRDDSDYFFYTLSNTTTQPDVFTAFMVGDEPVGHMQVDFATSLLKGNAAATSAALALALQDNPQTSSVFIEVPVDKAPADALDMMGFVKIAAGMTEPSDNVEVATEMWVLPAGDEARQALNSVEGRQELWRQHITGWYDNVWPEGEGSAEDAAAAMQVKAQLLKAVDEGRFVWGATFP